MAEKSHATILNVPRDLVIKSAGVAIDFGSSLIKVVYRDANDYQEARENLSKDATGRLRLINFPRAERQKAFQYVKEHAHLLPDTKVYTTGVGCSEYAGEILQALNVEVENISEAECFVHGLRFLSKYLPRSSLLKPLDNEAHLEGLLEMKTWIPGFKAGIEKGSTLVKVDLSQTDAVFEQLENLKDKDTLLRSSTLPLDKAEHIYPCMFAMLGSAFMFMKVYENGDITYADFSSVGGRTLDGIQNILVGNQSFEEFLEMAERGNSKEVNFHASDVEVHGENKDEEGDIYNDWMENMTQDEVVFFFGKGNLKQRESFKQQDLASALVMTYISDLAHKIHLMARCSEVKHVFVAGTLFSSTLVQKIFTAEFSKRNASLWWMDVKDKEQIKFDILVPGSQLGALGALVNSVDKFL